MAYLVAGVALFLLLFLRKRLCFFPQGKYTPFLILYLIFIFLTFILNLFLGLNKIIPNIAFGNTMLFAKIINWVLTFYLIIFTVVFYKLIFSRKDSLFKWIRISILGGILRFGIHLVIPLLPVVIFVYMGVLDLIILFGWLMTIVTISQKELLDGQESIYLPFRD
ncbi:hypothetical protein ACFL6A_03575 [bacterium]